MNKERLEYLYSKGLADACYHPCSLCHATDFDFRGFPHFHGSDFAKCPKSVQFEKSQAFPEKTDDQKKAMLRDGHVHEAAIVDLLRRGGCKITHRENTDEHIAIYNLWTEVFTPIKDTKTAIEMLDEGLPGKDGICVVGHTDGVIDGGSLLECKAVKEWAWDNKFSRNRLPKDYLLQMRLYMLMLDLPHGFLAVKNRHTSEIKFFEVERNDMDIKTRAWELRKIVDALETGEQLECHPVTKTEKKYCRCCKEKL